MKENPGTTEGYELDRDIYDALDAAGWMFPETPDEVERAEKELEQSSMQLPDHLANPSAIFDEICHSPSDESGNYMIRFPRDENIANSLARAARDGGDISQNLADRMREDRRKAQRHKDG